jgi:hypothetical protein
MVSNEDSRGIFTRIHAVIMSADLFAAGDAAGEYVASKTVEVTILARWQRTPTDHRLLDWSLVAMYLDGMALSEEVDIPSDFPMQQLVNAATISSKMRRILEGNGPGMTA